MSTTAQYASVPKLGIGQVSVGDASRTTPTQVATVFTAGANGSRIDRIALQALGTTTATAVRLFLHDGTSYSAWQELLLPASTPSGTAAGFSVQQCSAINPALLPLILPTGYSLRATVNDTQVTQAAQVDSIVAYGTLNGPVTLGNGRFTVTAASTAAVAALQTTAGAALLTLLVAPYAPAVPSLLTLTSTGNISAINFTISGTDPTGATISEVVAGPNNGTVFSTKSYAVVNRIFCSGAVATNLSVGIASSVNFPVNPTKITIASAANISAVTFTIRGIDNTGLAITETLAGPVAGALVTSVNTYKAITFVSASSSAATTVIGTPAVLTLINVIANGGDL